MSKKNNVNPDHYKTAGRMRPGEPGLQERQKQEYAQAQTEQAQSTDSFLPGATSQPRAKNAPALTEEESKEELKEDAKEDGAQEMQESER